jgi:hypothetical protein
LGKQAHAFGGEAEPPAQGAQQLDIADRFMPEGEVVTDHNFCHVQALDEHRVDELVGRHPG